jgi:hypothetical protein
MEQELRRMLGDAIYEELSKYLDNRVTASAPPLRHPAEVPVQLSPTRRHPGS